MKRAAIILSIVAVILVITIPGGAFFLGSSIQSYSEEAVAEANTYISPAIGQLSLPVYNKGLMSSGVVSRLDIEGEEDDSSLALNHTVYHGPLAFTPHGVKLGYAYVITTLNREAFPEELNEGINEIYGEEEPFVITSLVNYAGGQTIGIDITEVNYKKDTISIRFDGGGGQFDANANGITTGNLDLTALSLRNDSEVDSEDFIVRLKDSNFTIDSSSDNTMTSKGIMGGLEWRFANEDDGNPFTISMGELTMESSQTWVSEGSSLMLGSSSTAVPNVKFRSGEEFDLSINNLAVTTDTTSDGSMMTAEVIYSVGGMTTDMPIPEEFKLYSDMAGEGAELSFQATLPISLMEDLTELQQKVSKAQFSNPSGDLPPELEEELFKMIDGAIKSVSKGTGLGLGLRLGGGETETSVLADVSYMGAKTMIEQKTILELIKALEIKVGLNLPAAIIESTPALEEQMMPLLATGSIVQRGSSLSMDAELKDGVLKTNGEVNPMLEQMTPLLMGEIPWEEFMQRMRTGLTQ